MTVPRDAICNQNWLYTVLCRLVHPSCRCCCLACLVSIYAGWLVLKPNCHGEVSYSPYMQALFFLDASKHLQLLTLYKMPFCWVYASSNSSSLNKWIPICCFVLCRQFVPIPSHLVVSRNGRLPISSQHSEQCIRKAEEHPQRTMVWAILNATVSTSTTTDGDHGWRHVIGASVSSTLPPRMPSVCVCAVWFVICRRLVAQCRNFECFGCDMFNVASLS